VALAYAGVDRIFLVARHLLQKSPTGESEAFKEFWHKSTFSFGDPMAAPFQYSRHLVAVLVWSPSFARTTT
jgi:hypothetical protein